MYVVVDKQENKYFNQFFQYILFSVCKLTRIDLLNNSVNLEIHIEFRVVFTYCVLMGHIAQAKRDHLD